MLVHDVHGPGIAVWPLLITLWVAGCQSVETEEPEHHTPAHMPADYPAAVDRLLGLHVEIVKGRARSPEQLGVFDETLDVVRWLPALAADSDLPEAPWNRVHAASMRLDSILSVAMSQVGDRRREVYVEHETELDDLHRALIEVKDNFQDTSSHNLDDSKGT
jgi:hypothetical protein